jgi:hypothetical protein
VVRRDGRDVIFERGRFAIAVRATVGDRVSLVHRIDGEVVREMVGLRDDPEIIACVIEGALWPDGSAAS